MKVEDQRTLSGSESSQPDLVPTSTASYVVQFLNGLKYDENFRLL